MRQRHQTGGLRKQRGRWIGMWWVDGERKSRVLGFVKEMTKSKAREEVGKIVAEENKKRQGGNRVWHFGEFISEVFFPFYSRKWKASTRGSTMNRISIHLVADFKDRKLASFKRDELQDLLDQKVEKEGLSYSTVDHLRWDLKQVFDMAISEGHIERNPAQLLFTPRDAPRAKRARHDHRGSADLFFCSRTAGEANCEARHSCRNASREKSLLSPGDVSRNRHTRTSGSGSIEV